VAGTTINPSGGGRGVRFILGDFPALFGTERGLQLRKWCEAEGWALVWAMGFGGGSNAGGSPAVVRGNHRLLDATVCAAIVVANMFASLRARAQAAYKTAWATVSEARERMSTANAPNNHDDSHVLVGPPRDRLRPWCSGQCWCRRAALGADEARPLPQPTRVRGAK
jgi:hypothetical protein